MLAALDSTIVISEAPPIDSVLRTRALGPYDQRPQWLRWLISAYGRKRFPNESRLFIKFDSWSVIEFDIIRQAFPDTPWIFLYRNPVEVMVSQIRQPGIHMVPGLVDGLVSDVGDNFEEVRREEYCASILERICSSAIDHARCAQGLFVNYCELPGAFPSIVAHFDLDFTPAEMEAMTAAALFNAKTPQMFFTPDSDEKQRQATDAICEAAARLAPLYEKLEMLASKGVAAV